MVILFILYFTYCILTFKNHIVACSNLISPQTIVNPAFMVGLSTSINSHEPFNEKFAFTSIF